MHTQTDWRVVPSLAFDVLCLLNTLTGDDFYKTYHLSAYEHFSPLLTPEASQALENLKRKIKDDGQNIVSAFLCLYFSAVDVETIDDILGVLDDSTSLHRNIKQSPYYDDDGWRMFEAVRDDLRVILMFLKSIDFEEYWRNNCLPDINAKISETEALLPQYNVVPEVERHLGFALPSNTITVYVLAFTKPHGIKIVGTRFITDAAWSFEVVLRTAVHEMMHPPYMLDDELKAALAPLRADEFLMDKVFNHNPSFGYNSFEGYIEENCVQALDQYINERYQIARDPVERWQQADDGMHVLAAVLHTKLKQENFPQNGESFRSFLLRLLRSGALGDVIHQYAQTLPR